jgi:hypothetical protein
VSRSDKPLTDQAVNHSSTVPQYVPGTDETRIIALRALRELLDDAGPDDWDDLVASYRALHNAITKNKPMTRKDRARVAEHLRRLGWRERAIGAATAQADAHAGTVMRRRTNSKADGVFPSRVRRRHTPNGEGLRGFNGSKARLRRLSRQPFVNPTDGLLQPPRVAQIGEDATAAGDAAKEWRR